MRRFSKVFSVAMVILALFAMSGSALAVEFLDRADLVAQEFQLQSPQGSAKRLVLLTPSEWEAELFEQVDGTRIQIQTPAGSVVNFVGVLNAAMDDQELHALVTAMGMDHIHQAVEAELEIMSVPGELARGYFFRLTDKNPAPGEWKYLVSGFFAIEDSLWMFRMLTHEFDGLDERDLMEALKHVKLE